MKRYALLLLSLALLTLSTVAIGCNAAETDKKGAEKPKASKLKQDEADKKDAADHDAAPEEHAGMTHSAEGSTSDAIAADSPSIKIIAPADGSTVFGPNVSFIISVSNFKLSNAMSQANVAGEGHVGWILDNGAPNQNASTTLSIKGVKPGEHTMKVELHENLHALLKPPVEATIKFTVK